MTQSGWIDDRMTQELKTLAQSIERLDRVIQEDQRYLRMVQRVEPLVRIGGMPARRVVAIYTPSKGLVVASEFA